MIKLRIPIYIFALGFISGIYQRFDFLYLQNGNYLLSSIQFLGTVLAFFIMSEYTEISEKKVHFSMGIVLIIAGVLLDYYL